MRCQEKFKRIAVTESMYNRIIKDRAHFQEVIGGGVWSISDTLKEWTKILDTLKTTKGREVKKNE